MGIITGPNFSLLYDFDCQFDANEKQIGIVETVDGEQRSAYTFTGSGAAHIPLDLMGSFVNDGNTNRVASLRALLTEDLTWSVDFSTRTRFTFLAYTGMEGPQVSYAVQLGNKPQHPPAR